VCTYIYKADLESARDWLGSPAVGQGREQKNVEYIYIYLYIHIYAYKHIYVCIHIYKVDLKTARDCLGAPAVGQGREQKNVDCSAEQTGEYGEAGEWHVDGVRVEDGGHADEQKDERVGEGGEGLEVSKALALIWYRALTWYSSPARLFAAPDDPLLVTGQQGSPFPACRQLSRARNACAGRSSEESTKLKHGTKSGPTLC